MPEALLDHADKAQRPLYIIAADGLDCWLEKAPEGAAALIDAAGFRAKRGEVLLVPRAGKSPLALLGAGKKNDAFALGDAAMKLPEGDYQLAEAPEAINHQDLALAWLMGAYAFTRYTPRKRPPARIFIVDANAQAARQMAKAVYLARDLVNTPAADLNTGELEAAVHDLGKSFGARVSAVVGDDLLVQNYPMVHAVGRASAHAPRLVELTWGQPDHPRIGLVGKGVVFDTGGLDIKAAQYMRLMKKDMGGAANAMALAHMIMAAKLPVRLHMVLPIVDNAISGDAYRPSDILQSRKGISVEIDNTDAEGRLVLADALTRATEEKPELLIDFATLTGAARVALGPEMAPYYTDDEGLSADLELAAKRTGDPVWRMPLWDGYDNLLDSPIADICHTASSPMGGSITAALFLRRFVGDVPWVHFDIFAWVPKARPSHPMGGDAQGPRAVFSLLQARYDRN
ncbi:MAG: leucyl aminopeptidase [Robiginitomaculum sp.]|nr:MAG: leucyl aminopeptidase [Robiginitomaculum sp.]